SDHSISPSPSQGAIFDTRLQHEAGARSRSQEIDPLYLFACHLAWERHEEPSAGWELISAAHSANSDTRAHACALLSSSRHCGGSGLGPSPESISRKTRQIPAKDDDMKTPYELEIIENCA